MEPKIIQVVYKDPNIYGLAEDNKMYRWDFGQAKWIPFWKTEQGESIAPTSNPSEGGSIEL